LAGPLTDSSVPLSLSSSTLLPLASSAPQDPSLAFYDVSNWDAFPSMGLQSHTTNNFALDDGLGLDAPAGTSSHIPAVAASADIDHDASLYLGIDTVYQPCSGSGSNSPVKGSLSPSDTSTSKLSNPKSHSTESASRVEKRKQNTMAARRYRQKRVDQMAHLETTLKQTETERDDLKVRVARLEGEVETLRQLLRSQR